MRWAPGMSDLELCFRSATELAALIRERDVSPVEVTEAVLARADALQDTLNLFTTVLHEPAMEAARAAETAVMRGATLGPLHGVPLTVKDMVATRGIRTMMGSAIHEHGTCRMGADPRTSVLNAFNQMHEVPNVFVVDGSAFTSASEKNPTLSILALAWRATDYLADELRAGNL